MDGRGGELLVIAGGGLAGCLTALALTRLRPDQSFLLLESGPAFGGNHLWSFFDPDISPGDRWLVDPILAGRWSGYDIRFPNRRRSLATGYSSASSDQLDRLVRERLEPDQYRLGAPVTAVERDRVELADGTIIPAAGVIDARGFEALPQSQRKALDLRWQKFVGREYRFERPHGLERPIVMDATVEQIDGYRFVYSLPFDEHRLLIEDTYYSDRPELDIDSLRGRIDSSLSSEDLESASVEREEMGVLPVALGGDFESFWPQEAPARIGVMGGFFHPTTGYSLPDAVRTALWLARENDLTGSSLAQGLRREAQSLWKARRFYRLLNRMLFRAAAPSERYRVLQHFYRLDEDLIGRFYAGRSTFLDKARILSGKPPVPVGRALTALRS